jgi:hypothetical protein
VTDVRDITHRVRVAYRRTQADISFEATGQLNALTLDLTQRLRVGVVRQRERIDFFLLPIGIADALVELSEVRLRVAYPRASAVLVWTGSAFVPAPVSIWNGTTWVAALEARTWDGSSWV